MQTALASKLRLAPPASIRKVLEGSGHLAGADRGRTTRSILFLSLQRRTDHDNRTWTAQCAMD